MIGLPGHLKLTVLATIALAMVTGAVVLMPGRSDATLTDQARAGTNTFGNRLLVAPTLSSSVSGGTVTLSWDNPDALSGPAASFAVERASGACASPGAFAPIAGSPFNITTLSTTNAPGQGTWCYRVRTGYASWTSPFGAAQATVVAPSVTGLLFDGDNQSACSAPGTLTTGTADGEESIASGGTLFVARSSEGLTQLAAGTHTVTLTRTATNGAARPVTVSVGYCNGSTFTALGSASGTFASGVATISVNVSVAATTPLDATNLLAVRVSRSGGAVTLSTAGGSGISAPAGGPYRP
jgi:hypothetical protein